MPRRSSTTRSTSPPPSSFPAEPVPSPRRRRTNVAAALLDSPTELSPFETAAEFYDRGSPAADLNPRSFSYGVKQQCWDKAAKVRGRHPDRWRRDALGNLVFRKLVGCPGCLCHDYDHIVPFSKGGKSTLENCQVLQATVNRSKGNNMNISEAELAQKSAYCKVTARDMDLLEISAYGNVRRGPDSGGCSIQ